MTIETAIKIAVCAHEGQVDKCGEPYILHPLFVMNRMETEDEKVVAVLHDVAEDTRVTENYLKELGISDLQLEAVRLLTHIKGVPYMDYIFDLSKNQIARKVKMADLSHNMDFDRYKKAIDNGADEERMKKKHQMYVQAFHILISDLNKVKN